MYNFLLVKERFEYYDYKYGLLFKTVEARNIVIGHKVMYEDKLYEIIDIVYKKDNGKAYIKETNIYVEHIKRDRKE